MNERDHVLDLTAAYVLGAATTEEASTVDAHCATCPPCAADLAEMSGVAATLPLACDPVAPSATLKRRILAGARGEASAGTFLRNPARRSSAVPAGWWAAAAAALVVTAGALGTAAYTDHQRMVAQMDAMHGELAANQTAIQEIAAGRVWDMSGGTRTHWWHCTLVQPPKQQKAMLVASMPPAPKGMSFQAWIIHKGTLHDVGMVPAGTISMMHLPMPVQKGDVIAFSVEHVGGAATPTMPFAMRQALD